MGQKEVLILQSFKQHPDCQTTLTLKPNEFSDFGTLESSFKLYTVDIKRHHICTFSLVSLTVIKLCYYFSCGNRSLTVLPPLLCSP